MITDAERARRDVLAFTRGDCHVLARAIQIRTGWPIRALCGADPEPNYHAFVVMPDGWALDVLGVRSIGEIIRWAQATNPDVRGHVATDWPSLRQAWGATGRSTYAPKRARRVARELLTALERDASSPR